LAGSLLFVGAGAVLFLSSRPRTAPYRPGQAVEGITNALARDLPADAPRVQFADVTAAAGIDVRHFGGRRSTQLPEDMGSGAAWADYDGDGWADLFVVNFAGPLTMSAAERERSPATHRLYHNSGDGTFRDVTAQAGVGGPGFGMGAAWGDFDNDADLDLVVSQYGLVRLFRNDGADPFTDVGVAAGVTGPEGFWSGVSWSDYDRDGWLDLYVGGYVEYAFEPQDLARTAEQYGASTPFTLNPSSYPPRPNLLFRNRGDGTFEEVAAQAGVDNPDGRTLSATWSDFNGDLWPDLYVANDVSNNAMYLNNGDGTFAEVSLEALVADPRGAMGLATGDWDNDLDVDIFVTHWIAQENALYVNQLAEDTGAAGGASGRPAALARTRFMDLADQYGVGEIALDFIGWGTAFLDYDNDGRLDIFVANGSTFQDSADPSLLVPMTNQLFWNGGSDGFYEVGSVGGATFADPQVGRGAAVADYDNDGDPDVFVGVNGGAPRLLRNDGGNANRWLKVRLRGARNRFGVGARLVATAGGARQLREVGAGSSYLSAHDLEVVFGFGDQVEVASLVVTWPEGGVEEMASIPTNGTIEVTEGEGWRPLDVRPEAARGGVQVQDRAAPGPTDRQRILRFWELYRGATRAMKVDGDWQASVEMFREALAIDPNHEDSRYYLGSARMEQGDYAGALAEYERLVRLNPQSLRGLLQVGTVRSAPEAGELFDLGAAQAAFEAAVAINPEESGALLRLAATLLAAGDLERASESFQLARRLHMRAVESYYLDGYVRWKQGDATQAAALLAEAIELSQAAAPTPPAPAEGDTGNPGQKARLAPSGERHRLFGQLVAGLAERPPGAAITVRDAAAEYERVDAYLAGLPR